MGLSPEEIRHRRFAVRRRGYDTAEVDEFLERVADAVDKDAEDDAFANAGREIAHVLRATHEEAARLRAAASAEAGSILSQAEIEAESIHTQAEEERTKAKELLVRSRQRATELESEAEEHAAMVMGAAEQQARERVADVLRSGRERIERLVTDEQQARRCLLEAHADLQAVIHRVAEPRPVIDLTDPVTAFDTDAELSAATGRDDGDLSTVRRSAVRADAPDTMVRDAVERAVAHSTRGKPAAAEGTDSQSGPPE